MRMPLTSTRRIISCWRSPRFVLAFLLSIFYLATVCLGKEEDLYKLLGVSKTATVKEIKSAYRKKALSTHPDKNKGVSPEEAAKAFHAVVHAFEVLSDPESRRHFDRTGRSDNSQQNSGFGGGRPQNSGFQWTWSWSSNSRGGGGSSSGRQRAYSYQRQKQRLKDKFEVQQAQSRVLHVVSLEQLRTVMLDDDDLLERNVLICFVTPGDVEKLVDEEIVFPYPFAGMSSQSIWWEDMLQTVLVRYHRANDLTRLLGVPHGDEMRKTGKPIFMFGRRGETLNANWPRVETTSRQAFEKWVWDRIEVEVMFINRHHSPVEIYWIHGNSAKLRVKSLEPNQTSSHFTKLTHEWHVRDLNVDSHRDSPGRWKLTTDSSLITFKITSDANPQTLIIPLRKCYDLSGHCGFWKQRGECRKNPSFMKDQCPLSCNHCDKSHEETEEARAAHDEL